MENNAIEEYLSEIQDADYSLPVVTLLFEDDREGKPWESKLGGCPYLRSKEEYPIGKNGKPMLFLAQINLEEILSSVSILPDHGLLQFFVNYDDDFGVGEAPLVRYIEEITESENELLTVHPFADEAYLKALPFENPCKITFAHVEMSQDETEDSRIGGYPYFPQDGEFEPDEDFLLLQLADDPNICFGDCGACRFLISLEDLANRDFSDITYWWDCC